MSIDDEKNDGKKQFIIAATNALADDGVPLAPFIALQASNVLSLLPRAQRALLAAAAIGKEDRDFMPQVSFQIGAGSALERDGLQQLGLAAGEVHALGAVVSELDPDDVLEAVDPDDWNAAMILRVVFHEDGEVWLSITPKDGDPYEAKLSHAIQSLLTGTTGN